MKNIKIYLLMATLVFSTTACLDKYPDLSLIHISEPTRH